tara:strand:+ start:666057 stop:667643 length:1587 start_codon:yes stop_codon:yes gene_type:complete
MNTTMKNTVLNRPITRSMTIVGAALALSLSAGSAMAINAEPDHQKDRKQRMQSQHQEDSWLTLVRSDKVLGATVMGLNNEEVGSIDDLIIDRGTGRVAFAVIGYGGILTMGENLFAAEYNKLDYSSTDERFSISMTKEQAERQIEFLPDNWNDLSQSSWMDEITGVVDGWDTESYGDKDLASSKTMKLNGTVKEIKRDERGNAEDIIVSFDDQNGKSREVVLGPSWYIMGLGDTPSTNDRIELVAANHNGRLIATEARLGGKDIKLRDTNGRVYWKSTNHKTARYVLLSDLIGKNVEIGGSTSGEIQNAVVETTSGRVAFFGFDPNDNFLGLGDDVSLVPWSAMHIAADMTVWSESSEAQFGKAEPMPEDLSTLRTAKSLENAYQRFDLAVPNFSSSERQGMNGHSKSNDGLAGNAWSKNSALVTKFSKGKSVRMSGEFVRMDTATLENGAITATSMWIKTPEGNREVILGPNWFIDRQGLELNKGDRVSIQGRTASIDGRDYTAAWNVNQDTNTWALWDDMTPAWVD